MHWLTCDATDEFSSRCRAASVICCCTLQVVLTERRCGLHPDKIGAIRVAHSKLHLTGIVAGGLPVVTEAFRSWMIVYIAREANPNCCWILRTRRVGWDSHLQSYNAMQACKYHKKPKLLFILHGFLIFFDYHFYFALKYVRLNICPRDGTHKVDYKWRQVYTAIKCKCRVIADTYCWVIACIHPSMA